MQTPLSDPRPRMLSTCPSVTDTGWEGYAGIVSEAARWSEAHGCDGILVYSDNRQADPWAVSQIVVEATERICPFVAVQPVYAHPFAVASRIASIAHLRGRRVLLNMVAGGFRNDLIALGDPTPHDRRYERLVEYTRVVLDLLKGGPPVTLEGSFVSVRNLKLDTPLPPELMPEVFLAGSSEAGRAAARALGATPICYPEPSGEDTGPPAGTRGSAGIRVGIITRDDPAEAWRVARARFPADREGQLARQLASRVSDSVWHEKLTRMAADERIEDSPYWLVPFENYKTMCPYLVGSYDRVAEELSRYIDLGYDTFVLDIPRAEEDLLHTRAAFDRVTRSVAV